MREVFQRELKDVQDRLVSISKLVTTIMEDASEAFIRADKSKAERAINTRVQVDQQVAALDELVIWIMARQAPVARDLRTLVSALRISSSFDRMAALSGHLAEIALMRHPEPAAPESLVDEFRQLAVADVAMSKQLTTLLESFEVGLADEIGAEDDRVDELQLALFNAVLQPGWEGKAANTVDVTLAGRYFERYADHVVGIADKIVYLLTGETHDHS